MASLRIPERYRPGIVTLAALQEPAYQELLQAAKRVPEPFLNSRELDAWISSEVKDVDAPTVSRVLDSLTSLYRLRMRQSLPVDKLVSDIQDAAQEQIPNFNVQDPAEFQRRLTELLNLDSFNVIAVKAKELQAQSERIYCDSKVLTDLRPVFPERLESSPTAMIILHTLKLGFHDSGSSIHKELYLALDEADIKELKKVLERAEEKARSLKETLGNAGLRTIDLN